MQLTLEETKNIFIFLQRAELKGNESIVHANLLVKFDRAITEAQNIETPEAAPLSDPTEE